MWTQVLRNYPTDDLALAHRGIFRAKTGNIDGAQNDFELAIKDGCNRSDIYENIGNVYNMLGNDNVSERKMFEKKAILMFEKALDLDPESGSIYFNLGISLINSDSNAAETALKNALKLMPYNEIRILRPLGESQLNGGKFSDAIASFTKAIGLGVKTEEIFYYRGLSYIGLGDVEKAKNDLKAALLINPDNNQTRSVLSQIK